MLIRVTRCGMCHTDIHMWQGHYDLGAGRRFSLRDRGIEPPITPGHEVFGKVVAMGLQRSPLADANAALDDLINGRVVGRIVLDLD